MGSPAHRPLSYPEFIEWAALLNVVEPEEARKAAEQQKMNQPGRARVAGRRR